MSSSTLSTSSVAPRAVSICQARLQPGDLCLALVDQVQEALAHLAERVKEARDVKQVAMA